MARPMPRVPPVTRARLPVRFSSTVPPSLDASPVGAGPRAEAGRGAAAAETGSSVPAPRTAHARRYPSRLADQLGRADHPDHRGAVLVTVATLDGRLMGPRGRLGHRQAQAGAVGLPHGQP